MSNSIILCSGGLDSVVLSHYVLRQYSPEQVMLVFFDYRQKQLKQELDRFYKCVNTLRGIYSRVLYTEIDLGDRIIGVGSDAEYVPSRNLLFASHALNLAERQSSKDWKTIYFGFIDGMDNHKSDHWDATSVFLQYLNNLCAPTGIQFKAPFLSWRKEDVFALSLQYDIPLNDTWSCMHPTPASGTPCGKCGNCQARILFAKTPPEVFLGNPTLLKEKKWYNKIVEKVNLLTRHS